MLSISKSLLDIPALEETKLPLIKLPFLECCLIRDMIEKSPQNYGVVPCSFLKIVKCETSF